MMRILQFVLLLSLLALDFAEFTITADNDSLQERKLEEEVDLNEPCLVVEQLTSFVDSGPFQEILCQLQHNDSALLGPLTLSIDGLNPAWANSKGLVSGISTLFASQSKISGGKLNLPAGKSIENVTVGFSESNKAPSNVRRRLLAGNFDVLVVRVEAAGGVQTTASASELSTRFFDTSGSSTTFASQYAAVSYNQVTFAGTTDTVSFPGVSGGVYTVTISTTITSGVTDRSEVVSAITTQLNNDFGAGWANNVDHYFYIIPPGTVSGGTTSWTGTGQIPGKYSYYNDETSLHVNTIMHEVGHNFDLDHSGDVAAEIFQGMSTEYDDTSCIMGGSVSIGGTRQESKVFNGPKSYQLDWYADKAVLTSTSWDGRLYGVVDYSNAISTTVVIRIVDADGVSADDYYITFNRATGFNSQTNEGENLVLVTKRQKGTARAKSWLQAELNDSTNNSFFVSDFGLAGGLTIQVNAIDLTATPGFADLSIMIDTRSPTISPAPSMSPAPTFVPIIISSPTDTTTKRKGIAFNVRAKNALTIVGFNLHMIAGTFTVNIWTLPKASGPFPNLMDSAWVERITTDMTGAGTGAETIGPDIGLPGIDMPAAVTWTVLILLTPVEGDLATAADKSLHTQYVGTAGPAIRTTDSNMDIYSGTGLAAGTNPPGQGYPIVYSGYYEFEGSIKYILPATPSESPTAMPSLSQNPSMSPSDSPSVSLKPSMAGSFSPSVSIQPSPMIASSSPSATASDIPSLSMKPSLSPTDQPSMSVNPSVLGSFSPSVSAQPSNLPSATASDIPSLSMQPSLSPSDQPSTSTKPSFLGSLSPSVSVQPSHLPSATESDIPSVSIQPTLSPSDQPSTSVKPSVLGSLSPSVSAQPSNLPSATESNIPSVSIQPTLLPSNQPSMSLKPSVLSSSSPSASVQPSPAMASNSPSTSEAPSGQAGSSPSISTSESDDVEVTCSDFSQRRTCIQVDQCVWKNKKCREASGSGGKGSSTDSTTNSVGAVDCSTINARKKCKKAAECRWKGSKCVASTTTTSNTKQVSADCATINRKKPCKNTQGCKWNGTTCVNSGSVQQLTGDCSSINRSKPCKKTSGCTWNGTNCVSVRGATTGGKVKCRRIQGIKRCNKQETCEWKNSKCTSKVSQVVGCERYGKRQRCNNQTNCQWSATTKTCVAATTAKRRLLR